MVVKIQLRGLPREFGRVPISRCYSVKASSVENDVRELDQSLTLYIHRFPDDLNTNVLINRYRSLGTNGSSEPIKMGVYYKNKKVRKSSRILECLLADPLALNSNQWFHAIANRKRDLPLTIKFGDHSKDASSESLRIPSPILSAQLKPQFPGITDHQTPAVSLEIHETRNLISEWSLFHFVLGVTDDPNAGMGTLPPIVQDQIALAVIDNLGYTPQSMESTPVTFNPSLSSGIAIKINSITAYEGTEKFYHDGVVATKDMVHLWRDSNVFELFKAVIWALNSPMLKKWTLSTILKEIKHRQVEQLELLERQKQSERLISEFGQAAHEELLLRLVPRTKRFFEKRLSWWRLYFLNDNVEYELKDFYSREFMPLSIENYSYQRGNLDVPESGANPLLDMKNQLITHRIRAEVQPVVTRLLAQALIIYQLPLTLLGFASYQWFDFSANAAIALVLMGLTAGFNHVSRSWVSFLKEWTQRLFEQVRVCIDRDCLNGGLLKDFKQKHAQEWQDFEIRDKVAHTIEKYTGNK